MADFLVVTVAPFARTGLEARFTDRRGDGRGGASRPPYDEANLATHVGDDATAVAANREALAARVAAPVVWMEQTHGAEVAVVEGPRDDPVTGVDALVTTRTGVALAVLVADCVPVVLHDPEAAVLAVAHAGRRGLASGVVPRTVEVMSRLAADPGRLRVWLGPSICGRCYEVPVALRAEVEAVAPGSATTTSAGRPGIDLRAGLRHQLASVGLQGDAIRDVGPCTFESADHFSHRRDAVTGRCAAVAQMRLQ